MKTALVVTTINPPTAAMELLARGCQEHGWSFYVVGDSKTPKDWALDGAVYIGPDAKTGFNYERFAPVGHYARKNLGYLLAMRDGAEVIVETDDDNQPLADFWLPRDLNQECYRHGASAGWVNVYSSYWEGKIWPRGFPLNELDKVLTTYETFPAFAKRPYPIQQGLVNLDPDVDAIWRLVFKETAGRVSFRRAGNVSLDAWCPFNSQNTTWFKVAFPAMYLPAHVTPRITDIWRSLVAQRVLREQGYSMLFTEPTMQQFRNEHDLMADFCDEIGLYLDNADIALALSKMELQGGWEEMVPDCWDEIRPGRFRLQEMTDMHAWLADVASLQSREPVCSES